VNLLLALSVFALFARPEPAPPGPADLELVRELASRVFDARANRIVNWAEAVPGQFVVGYATGREADAISRVKAEGGTVLTGSVTGGDFLVAQFPAQDQSAGEELIVRLQDDSAVRYAEPQIRCRALFTPNDPYYLEHQWGNWVMYSDRAWDLSTGSRDVKVAVVDQGIDYTHPELSACFDPGTKGHDFVNQDPDPMPVNGNEMHGTHVAGIIAAGSNNAAGIAGWANVTLYSCRALNDSGSGSTSDIADGMRWAVDHGVQVINLSLGATSSSSVMQDAALYAWNHGVLLVCASGNNGMRGVFFPAAYDQCIAVGAFDSTGVLAQFSNYGPEQELTAPGVGILSTTPGNRYYYMDGTSMASPEVAGLAALLFSYRPGLSNRQVRAILAASAIDQGEAGRDEYYGFGLVNAFRALSLAQLYGAELEPARALNAPAALPSVIRGADLLRRLPGQSVLLDAQGRVRRSAAEPGVYFILPARGHPGDAVKVTVVE
jgi:subtilisin family serine protease